MSKEMSRRGYIEIGDLENLNELNNCDITGKETFERVSAKEWQIAKGIINRCTHETFQEFIEEEEDEVASNGGKNGHIHYKLPNGLHVYVYVKNFEMSLIDQSFKEYSHAEVQVVASEVGEKTRNEMQKLGFDAFIYLFEEQPCLEISIEDNKLKCAEYHFKVLSEKVGVDRIIAFDEGLFGELITTIQSPKNNRTILYPCDDSQLLDDGFFDAIQTSDNLSDEQKRIMIEKLLEFKKAVENELNNYQGIKLLKTTDTTCQFDIFKIESGTIKGVNIPCILALPKDLKGKSKLTLVFNNENGETLDASVENIVGQLPDIIDGVQFASPVIIPILPSQQEFNQSLEKYGISLKVGESKQFARECFSSEIPSKHPFYRLDNQVATLIQSIITSNDIKAELQSLRTDKDTDFVFSTKLNGFGHSGAGAAMLRFALLHPEMLDTLIIGGNGDIIPTPFGANGAQLEYPFGIKDYNHLLGRDFSKTDYTGINFQFYIGEREDTKPVYDTIRDENYEQGKTGNNFAPEEIAKKYKNLYGTAFFERFKNALRQYEENGCTVGLKIYEDDCHSVIQANDLHGILDGKSYFVSNCSEQLQEMLSSRHKPVVFSEQKIGKETIGTLIAIKDIAQSQMQGDLKDLTIQKEEEIATQVLD